MRHVDIAFTRAGRRCPLPRPAALALFFFFKKAELKNKVPHLILEPEVLGAR